LNPISVQLEELRDRSFAILSKECLMRHMILPLALFVFAACQPGASPLTDEAVTAVRELGQSYVRGFSTGDADGVAAVYAEGAVEMPPGFPARNGVDDIRSAYESYFEAGAETVAFGMTAVEISGFDGLAFDRGSWSWTGREAAGTELVTQTGKYLALARRQEDGSWQYTAMIWNSDAPVEPTSPPE
jgi:ketosteroid isomerase-like protein